MQRVDIDAVGGAIWGNGSGVVGWVLEREELTLKWPGECPGS